MISTRLPAPAAHHRHRRGALGLCAARHKLHARRAAVEARAQAPRGGGDQADAARAKLLEQISNYRYLADVPGGGQLVVSLLRPELVPQAADLLTDTFVDTKGIQPYRRYVRRNILSYLELHAGMPPDAAVVTALLVTQAPAGGATRGQQQEQDQQQSQQAEQQEEGQQQQQQQGQLQWQLEQQQQQQQQEQHGDGIGGAVQSALQQLAGWLGETLRQPQRAQATVVRLVGVAEVSFRPYTRSSYLTLNPPKSCAYLCNMAVASDCRRRGIASHLIAAAEDLAALAGESEVFLHLRFKDEGSAGGLYSKAGFTQCKRDWPVVLLLGLEPRSLLRKVLPAGRPLAGRVEPPQAPAAAAQGGWAAAGGAAAQAPRPTSAPAASPAA